MACGANRKWAIFRTNVDLVSRQQEMSHFPNQCWPSITTTWDICRCFGKWIVSNINMFSQSHIPLLLPVLSVANVIRWYRPVHTNIINRVCVVKLVCKVCLILNKVNVSKQRLTMFCNDVCQWGFILIVCYWNKISFYVWRMQFSYSLYSRVSL